MSIKQANQEAIRRIEEGNAMWIDLRLACDVVPGMEDLIRDLTAKLRTRMEAIQDPRLGELP